MNETQVALRRLADSRQAEISKGFFKTGPGEYGEGDTFIGVSVPRTRQLAIQYQNLPFEEITQLLKSPVHEDRILGLFILLIRYQKATVLERKKCYDFYLKNMHYVNNWDLVDLTAYKIVGDYLEEKDKRFLYQLAEEKSVWLRRIAIVSTLHFIRKNNFRHTLAISKLLMKDTHDLIHKAAGWMLREVAKKDLVVAEDFLGRHYKKMPRTMLRYAIEKMPPPKRQAYLKGRI